MIEEIAAASNIDGAMQAFDAAATDLGADSVAYGYVRDGEKQPGWSSTPETWRRVYRENGLARVDPEFQIDSRLPYPTIVQFDGTRFDPPVQALYDMASTFGYTGVIYIPDRSPEGMVEMATLNAMLKVPNARFLKWAETAGRQIILLGSAVLWRLRELRREAPVHDSPLSRREEQVLAHLARGARPSRIAEEMEISQKTVDFHLGNARRKLGAKTRDQAVALALRDGWLALQ